MEKEKIFQILNDWNFWKEKEKDTGIKREEYLKKIIELSKSNMIITLTGSRQAGKSTLMFQYAQHLISKGIPKKEILYINFEDPRFENLSLELIQQIYETYMEELSPKGNPYLFLDEVQLVNGWEKFVRAIHERKDAQIIVSGSSSKLLSSEFGTVLTGRHLSLNIYPLSFKEFLIFNNLKIEDKLELIDKRFKIKRLLKEYLKFGGFPRVVLNENKQEILTQYFEDIISKDVIERYKIREIGKVRELSKFYLTNISNINSFNKIKQYLGLSLESVERYSSYLESVFLISLLKKFSYKLKEQELNPRKVFCIDPGIRNAVSFKFSEDKGKLVENIVFIELKKQKKGIYYWKNKKQQEVDFVIKEKDQSLTAINVSFTNEILPREIKALLSFKKNFKKCKNLLIITEDKEGEEKIDNKKIKYVPLWKWLLA